MFSSSLLCHSIKKGKKKNCFVEDFFMSFHSPSDSLEPLVRTWPKEAESCRPTRTPSLAPFQISTVITPHSRETRYKNPGDANFHSICKLSALFVTCTKCCDVAPLFPRGASAKVPTLFLRTAPSQMQLLRLPALACCALMTMISCIYN